MLHVLTVPIGTRLLAPAITGSPFYEYPSKTPNVYSSYVTVGAAIPYPGSPTLSSEPCDLGWIAEGNIQNGQRDVEHLDLDGTLVPKSICQSFGDRSPSMSALPPVSAQMFSLYLHQEFDQRDYEVWFTEFIPHMGKAGSIRDRTCKAADNEPWAPWRFAQGAYWPRSDCLVLYSYLGRLDSSTKYPATITCFKFGNNFRDMVRWSRSVSFQASALTTWEAPLERIWYWVFSDYITKTPVVGATFAQTFTTKTGSTSVSVPVTKILDRSYVLNGELNPVWGDLAYECYSQVQLWNGNGLAYGRDLTLITSAVRDLFRSVRSLLGSKNPVEVAKPLADLFLSFRYGWYLTAKDTLSLLEADYARAYPMGRCKRSTAYTYFRNGNTIQARMSIYCRPYSDSIASLGSLLSMFDCDLTLDNIWDLIPLSFVVDWVVNVGGVLDRLDMLFRLDKYHVFLTGQTLKVTAQRAADEIWQLASMVGTVSVRYYKRAYTADVIPPSLASSRIPNQKFDHWLEGSALAIQRLG